MPKVRIFYGWWIVISCVVILTMSSGPGFYCFSGVFTSYFEEVFEWKRSMMYMTISLHWIIVGIMSPFTGRLVNRFGAKKMMLAGIILSGVGLIALSQTNSLPYLYAIYPLVSIGSAAAGLISMGIVVSHWFVRKRGLAMGIVAIGIALGGLVLVPISQFVASTTSWRYAYITLGLMSWILCIPLILFAIKSRPEEMGLLPDGDSPEDIITVKKQQKNKELKEEIWSLKEAARTRAFWLCAFAILLTYMALFGVMAHQKLYHVGIGFDATTAAIIYSITAGMGIGGKLGFGYLADKIQPKYSAALCFGLQSIGVLFLILTANFQGLLWPYVLIYGAAMGGVAAVQPLLVISAFGVASFPVIYGTIALIFSLGMALGPSAAGWIYDALDSYQWAFVCFLAAYLLAAVATLFINKPKQKTDIVKT